MGGRLSCISHSSYDPRITRKIRRQREIAALHNDICEKEDLLWDLRIKIAKLERRQNKIYDEKVKQLLEERKRIAFEQRLRNTLENRKQMLLDVINVGIEVQDLERELAANEHKYSTLWSLAYEDDPEDQSAEWKRDLRRTRSHNDVNEVVPKPPIVPPLNDMPILYYSSSSENDLVLDEISASPSMERLLTKENVPETEI